MIYVIRQTTSHYQSAVRNLSRPLHFGQIGEIVFYQSISYNVAKMDTIMDFKEIMYSLRSAFGFPVSCLVVEDEALVIARVFMVPAAERIELKKKIRAMEKCLVPDTYMLSVITYSEKDTKTYYPEMYAPPQNEKKSKPHEYVDYWTQTQSNVCDQAVYAA